jgi:hypothetical protein
MPALRGRRLAGSQRPAVWHKPRQVAGRFAKSWVTVATSQLSLFHHRLARAILSEYIGSLRTAPHHRELSLSSACAAAFPTSSRMQSPTIGFRFSVFFFPFFYTGLIFLRLEIGFTLASHYIYLPRPSPSLPSHLTVTAGYVAVVPHSRLEHTFISNVVY